MNRTLLKTVVFTILFSAGIHAQWVKTGFAGHGVQYVAAKDTLLYALSTDDFYSSKDNGAAWDSLSTFNGPHPDDILFLNDTMFVYANWAIIADLPSAALASSGNPCIFRSVDGGHTWKAVLSTYTGAGSVTINQRTLFCTAEPKHLLKSADYGETWDTLSLTPPAPDRIDHLFSNNGVLYATQNGGGLFRSSDNGQNWKDISAGLQPLGFSNLFASSKYIFIEKDSILYRSSDEGENWETLEIPLKPRLSVFNALAADSLVFLTGFSLGTTTAKVYAGTIKDNKWKDISAGLPEGEFILPYALAVKGSWLFLAAGMEVWKYDLSKPLAVEGNALQAKTFRLSQNYPNPFNPSTQISFHLPEGAKVTLRVYDMLGKEAAVLMDEYRPAGTHTVKFSASALPSGMYIYQLRAGEHIEMRKMMMIK